MSHQIFNNGIEIWLNENSFLHRDDGGPAIIGFTGSEEWHKDGVDYRKKNFIMIYVDGKDRFEQKNLKHIIGTDGMEYRFNEKGKYHREDGGPSYISSGGSEYFMKYGNYDRIKNPIIISMSGYEEWREIKK